MAAPPNTTCATADVIASLPFSVTGLDTTACPTDGIVPSCTPIAYKAVWYTWTATAGIDTILLSTINSSYNTAVVAYSGVCGSLIEWACNYGILGTGNGYQVTQPLSVTTGTVYYFLVVAPDDDGGLLTFTITELVNITGTVTNTTPETALIIPCGTYTFRQDVSTAPIGSGYVSGCLGTQAQQVWYQWTAPADMMIEIFVSNDDPNFANELYTPKAILWEGTPPSLTLVGDCSQIAEIGTLGVYTVTSGTTYYLQVVGDDTVVENPAHAIVSLIFPPSGSVAVGDLVVGADDPITYPMATIYAAADGTVEQVLPMAASGEYGVSLPNGYALVQHQPAHATPTDTVALYAPDLTFITDIIFGTISRPEGNVHAITSNRVNAFYVIWFDDADPMPPAIKVSKVTTGGSVSATWTIQQFPLTVSFLQCAVLQDDSALYFLTDDVPGDFYEFVFGSSTLTLIGSLAGTAAGVMINTGPFAQSDTKMVFLQQDGATRALIRMNPAGAVLDTYPLDVTDFNTIHAFAPAPDNLSVWVWQQKNVAGASVESLFTQILLSDGSTLASFSTLNPNQNAAYSGFLGPTTCPFFTRGTTAAAPTWPVCPVPNPPPTSNPTLSGATLDCENHRLTITGSGFTTSTVFAVKDPSNMDVPYSVVSISDPAVVLELLAYTANGSYTVLVNGTATAVVSLTCGTGPGNGWITDPIRALRRFPLPFDAHLLVFLWRLEVLLQSGVGNVAGDGADPKIMLRLSKDGGKTWGNEYWRSMGKIGEYARRAYWNSQGQARNWVCEIVVSDPVFAGLIACYVDVQVGVH